MKNVPQIGWILICLALALGARTSNLKDVFIDGRIYFVDADCYSRMTRAALVAEHPGIIVRHHDFENWPEGTTPHTTALLDYVIVGLKGLFDIGFALFDGNRTSILHEQTLDLAGAVVSPLLGLGTVLMVGLWWWRFRVRYGGMALLLCAISPILVHGTSLGRPDHQSLLIFLLTIAGLSELILAIPLDGPEASPRSRVWGIVAGVAWGLGLWVSLYEPLILLAAVLAVWLVADRQALWAPERRMSLAIAFGLVALSLVIEGWRVAWPSAEDRAQFGQWAKTIGELNHLGLHSTALFGWLGWTILGAPILLFLARKSDRRALPLLGMVIFLLAMTIWQVRWGYFLASVFALALPWVMRPCRQAWLAWAVFLGSLWPVLSEWDTRLYPDEYSVNRLDMQRAEAATLRDLVSVTAGNNAGPILAPWWLSPSIAYWSQNPCVAGSSHQSLPGIVDTARFFLSASPEAAAPILRARRVRWVLADAAPRVIATSSAVLDQEPPLEPLASILIDHPDEIPEFLQEWKGTAGPRKVDVRFYRLYQVDDAKLPL